MDTRTAVSKPLTSYSPAELIAMGALMNPEREAVRLERILHPASREQRLSAILNLMGQFAVAAPEREDERQMFFEGYLLALKGYPILTILETCRAFVRGSVNVSNREFMPKPATIGAELSRRVDDFRSRLQRARKQADENRVLADHEVCEPLRPETRAYGERVVAELRSRAEEKRRGDAARLAPRWEDPNPITLEALEAAGVPDAPPRSAGMGRLPIPDALKNLKRSA